MKTNPNQSLRSSHIAIGLLLAIFAVIIMDWIAILGTFSGGDPDSYLLIERWHYRILPLLNLPAILFVGCGLLTLFALMVKCSLAPVGTRMSRLFNHLYTVIVAIVLSSITFTVNRGADVLLWLNNDIGLSKDWRMPILHWLNSPISVIIAFGLSVLFAVLASNAPPTRATRINHLFATLSLAWIMVCGFFFLISINARLHIVGSLKW